MVKKIIAIGFLLSSVFVASVVTHLPAQVVVQYAPLPKQLKISGVEGSLWQGSAAQVSWKRENLGQVQWDLKAAALFTGKAEAQIRFGRGSQRDLQGRGLVGYSLAGVYAKNMLVSLPVSEVMELAPPIPVPIDIGGRVELNLRDYAYAAPYCGSATGSLVVTSDSISTPIADLVVGPVIADFTCQENKVEISGQQDSEQVMSGFSATLETNRRYSSQAWFTPQDAFPSELADQLKWLPKPDAEGKYRFKYSGRL